jgi:hypothetical protein
MQDPPKLDYATPRKRQPGDIAATEKVVGIFVVVVYGVLGFCFGVLTLGTFFVMGAGHLDDALGPVVFCLAITLLCIWRLVSAVRRMSRSQRS